MIQNENTFSDYQQRIVAVLQYIESHIDDPLSVDTAAHVACFSPFHFHRIFHAFVGESLYAYIKRLRLERAAQQLCISHTPVTAISFQAGYETPAAFARAFRERFGISPTGFRTTSVFRPQTRDHVLQPEIRHLDDQPVLFVRRTGSYDHAADDAWKALMKHALWRVFTQRQTSFIGISHDDPRITDSDRLRYEACITIRATVKPKGDVGIQILKGGAYAVFLHRGTYERFSETYDRIFAEWLPASGYSLRNIPHFERYLNRNPKRTKPENMRTELFIPLFQIGKACIST